MTTAKQHIFTGDDGVRRVEEFHRAFDCVITEGPWMPPLSESERREIEPHALLLAQIGRTLKVKAADANRAGQPLLGLLLARLQLQVEETAELAQAMVDQDLVAALDALTDISYVTDGTYLTLGLQGVKAAADREVHRSNMSKLAPNGRPIVSAAGRVEKGPNYTPPDLAGVLSAYTAWQGGGDADE